MTNHLNPNLSCDNGSVLRSTVSRLLERIGTLFLILVVPGHSHLRESIQFMGRCSAPIHRLCRSAFCGPSFEGELAALLKMLSLSLHFDASKIGLSNQIDFYVLRVRRHRGIFEHRFTVIYSTGKNTRTSYQPNHSPWR